MKKFDKNRRSFLKTTGKGVGIALGAAIVNTLPVNLASAAETDKSNKLQYPFTLGIASGDPLSDGVVLWTRLAPDPLNGGGMDNHPFPVQWEVALDSNFHNVVKRGTELSKPQLGHSVHVEVDRLEPSTWYYYRFKAGSEISPTGRTKTAPAFNSQVEHLNFAFVSCQNWPVGYYTAYQHLAKDDLDLVIHLGDYIYEGKVESKIRPLNYTAPEIYTIDDYRNRYALYKMDSDLQAAHANFPWIVTFDDHEVDNNYAGDVPQDPDKQPTEEFLKRRAIAYQAYYEHMPLRRTSLPNGSNIQIFRRISFGNLVEFNVLDTRQYRDDQANGDKISNPSPGSEDPNRSILGEEQERWLLDGLAASQAKWKVLAQQVFFAQRDFGFNPDEELYSMDAWDGYPATRQHIVDFLAEKNIKNTVIITGDVHSSWANEVKTSVKDPNGKNVAVEFVGTSISSGGDGSDVNKDTAQILHENPHIKFFNNRRGYVRCKITQQTWQADYQIVPYVTRPGAPVSTAASFMVEDEKSSLKQLTATPL
ncbi:alkaline phosphatase D family protein [Bacillus sp. 3103sda1]|uniref:alkaline phosphatase D family protein n=1 Tax=Bacillus sp. 3103sda1 TaxID=2953808 RepID=UPI00209D2EE9|nr:alkaline phosphatase D family protein [Bacillus sp. 3103sda1]MCP1123409.1 alkaline phosphatase D family protein [Bacillus sp. 3103sda1]